MHFPSLLQEMGQPGMQRVASLDDFVFSTDVSIAETISESQVGLYTILPSSILYGVWHTKGGEVGGRMLRNRLQ